MMRKITIVTGLSGAGLSSALKVLEDQGYEVLDNFPVIYIEPLIEQTRDDQRPLALGVDTRTRGFSPKTMLKIAENIGASLLFLTADDAVLQKRFSETRRRHPLAKDRPVSAGIDRERRLLSPLSDRADLVIDTTNLSIHDLRHQMEGHFSAQSADRLTITVMSFGFRRGTPREADIMMDVRFLKNPNWQADLKEKTGKETDVGDYICQDPAFAPFMSHFQTMLDPLLPLYEHEGKNYLTIAIGCTGGRHRSVFCAETIGKWLESLNYSARIIHRDI